MASKLFKLASAAARRQARRQFSRTAAGKIASQARRIKRSFGSRRRTTQLMRSIASPEIRLLLDEIQRHGGTVTKYGKSREGRANLERLLKLLGPIGQIVRAAITPQTQTSALSDEQLQAAVEVIRAFGGEVLTAPGTPHHQRGVEAAEQLLREISKPTGEALKPPQEQPEDVWPEEQIIQTLGRGAIGYDEEETRELISREIRVNSSNVYSFVYEKETNRSGILYVTFLAWHPGIDRRSGPGPTYAYYDVPLSKYRRFEAAAENKSAGRAVWDYLRVRGSVHEHQHTYRLVAGTLVQESGQYVPRKATAKGFKKRAVASVGIGRRTVARSTLPEREFKSRPNRGRPNNGAPNRGR